MKLFITGSNGYLGRNFIKKVSKKTKIFAVTSKKKNKKIKNVKWLIGNIEKNWKELKRADILIHFATVGATDKYTPMDKTFELNVIKSTKLLLNAAKNNCKKWIIISTNKEDKIKKLIKLKKINKFETNEPHYNYSVTKYLFTKICKEISILSKAKCRILKVFQVYGADEAKGRLWPLLKNCAKRNKNLNMTSGKQIYDFIHIDDVVDGLIDSLNFNKKNKFFPQEWDLASGKSTSVKNFASKIWKNNQAKAKIFFSKIKNFDRDNYLPNKKRLWKIKSRKFK